MQSNLVPRACDPPVLRRGNHRHCNPPPRTGGGRRETRLYAITMVFNNRVQSLPNSEMVNNQSDCIPYDNIYHLGKFSENFYRSKLLLTIIIHTTIILQRFVPFDKIHNFLPFTTKHLFSSAKRSCLRCFR